MNDSKNGTCIQLFCEQSQRQSYWELDELEVR